MLVALGAGPAQAAITSINPANGSTLTGSSQTFSWTGTGVTQYWLWVGTSVGTKNILDSGSLGTALSTTVNGLPTNGSTVYVRLWHLEGGNWLLTDYTYTAFTAGGGTGERLSAVPPWDQTLPAADRFVLVMGGVAVLDKETGLVWDKSPLTGSLMWSVAGQSCVASQVGGRKGWRLPSVPELASLVDPAQQLPALPPGHPFGNIQVSLNYWSASTNADTTTNAWSVNFGNGTVRHNSIKTDSNYYWCVRGAMNADAY
jgi:hypothetical protein